MEAADVLFGRRIRQNHALEHATVTILTRDKPDLVLQRALELARLYDLRRPRSSLGAPRL